VQVPSPVVPENLRTKIAQLIRQLGDPEYPRRRAARDELKSLGHLGKGQLNEAVGQTADVEVRRAIEKLLEELKE
jgi:hypothetical protein